MKSAANHKIDVHAHYLPPGYADELRGAGLVYPGGMRDYPEWSPESALETYDQLGTRDRCSSSHLIPLGR
jgi:6-methylsalicylate decarboxylase